MKTIYIITDCYQTNWVLDLYTDKHVAENDMNFYHSNWERWETYLFSIKYDDKKYDYERENYRIEFFKKWNETIDKKDRDSNWIEIRPICMRKTR